MSRRSNDDDTTPEASATTTTDEAPAPRSAEEALRENQAKGHQGIDAAEAAGGIDKLRDETRERLERDGDNTGSTLPDVSPGHPGDPTVSKTTTAG